MRLAQWLAPFALFLLVMLAFTWPLPIHLNTVAFGWPDSDQPEYLWSLWYSTQTLLRGGNPARLDLLAYPDGYLHTVRQATLVPYITAIPLAWLPPVALYNAMVILGSALTGYVTYLLVLDLTGRRSAALVGGLVFLWFPSRWAHVLAGHLDIAQTYWYPLALLALRRFTRKPTARRAVGTAAIWAMATMNSLPGTAYILVPLSIGYTAFALVRSHLDGRLIALVPLLGLMAVVGGLILLPFAMPLANDVVRDVSWLLESGDVAFSASVLGLLAPPTGAPVWHLVGGAPATVVQATAFHPQETVTYIGIIPALLAVYAVVTCRRRGEVVWFSILSLCMAALALGPVLKLAGDPIRLDLGAEAGTTLVPLPYGLLASLPGYSVGRTPSRFILLTGLLLALLSGRGVSSLLDRLRPGPVGSVLIVAVISALLAGEYAFAWPAPVYRLPRSSAAASLKDAEEGAVVNVPVFERQASQEGLLLQIQHEHPMFGGYIHRTIPVPAGGREVVDWATRPDSPDDLGSSPSTEEAVAALRAADIRYVVLHLGMTENASASIAALTERLGAPIAQDEVVAIYEVAPGSPPGNLLVAEHRGRWEMTTSVGEAPARWLGADALRIGIYSPQATSVDVTLEALALDHARRLAVSLNGEPVGEVIVGPRRRYRAPSVRLREGFNLLEGSVKDACTPITGDPRCVTHRAFGTNLDCESWSDVERCVGILLTSLSVEPGSGDLTPNIGPLLLSGVRYAPSAAPSKPLDLVLTWQVTAPVLAEPHVFIHVLDPQGNLVAQQDLVPLSPFYAYDLWQSGDMITELFTVTLPEAPAAAEYRLVTGAYTYPDLLRIPVDGPGASPEERLVEVGFVTVEADER